MSGKAQTMRERTLTITIYEEALTDADIELLQQHAQQFSTETLIDILNRDAIRTVEYIERAYRDGDKAWEKREREHQQKLKTLERKLKNYF